MTHKNRPLATLSVVMIVKNEAQHLDGCLASVADLADEIIIVDSGSTDGTEAIARAYRAKFFSHKDWQGFGKQRQVASSYATSDYILALDADERVTPKLKKSIAEVLAQPLKRDRPFSVKRRNLLNHQYLYPLGYREKIIRLYSRVDFQYNSLEVHESVAFDRKKAKVLAGNLDHYFCSDLAHYRKKHKRYAQDWAHSAYARGKKTNLGLACIKATFCFFKHYLVRGGFLSGRLGLRFSWEAGIYTWNKYRILQQLHKN